MKASQLDDWAEHHDRIAALDDRIVELLRMRTEEERQLAVQRQAVGAPRAQLARENAALRFYEQKLGKQGISVVLALLEMART